MVEYSNDGYRYKMHTIFTHSRQMGFPYLIAVAYKYFTRGSDV